MIKHQDILVSPVAGVHEEQEGTENEFELRTSGNAGTILSKLQLVKDGDQEMQVPLGRSVKYSILLPVTTNRNLDGS